MSWLFPFYLLGAVAIIGPILMHLRKRPPQERVEFSSLMFLESQTPMPVSKRRLEHWLLLLLRCFALILLALMFARPLWRNEDAAPLGQREAIYILVDRSASMRRADLWSQAKAEAVKRIALMDSKNRLAVAVFDEEIHPLWTFAEDQNSASSRQVTLSQRLQKTPVSWARTDLGQALVEAATAFTRESGMSGLRKRIVVITDFQEGSRLEALRGQVWPENISVLVHRLDTPNHDNLALNLAVGSDERSNKASAGGFQEPQQSQTRVRLTNSRDSKVVDYTLGWDRGGHESLEGYLPPGASRVLVVPPKSDEKLASMLKLTGDVWDFDNRVFVAPPHPKTVHLVFIGDKKNQNEAASPLFYLSRALQPTALLQPELEVVPSTAPGLPPAVDLVFISGAELKSPMQKALRSFLESGGMVVTVVDGQMQGSTLEELGGVSGITIKAGLRAKDSDYLMLGEIVTSDPLLRSFADERLRDFTKVRFWNYRQLELRGEAIQTVKVMARFDNQSPALLSLEVGKGHLILMTSGWHPADSQLALSTKFVPLLYGWLDAAGFHHETVSTLLVGDTLHLNTEMTQVIAPDGQVIKVETGRELRAEMPGIYTAESRGGLQFAVNLPPEESRIIPYELEKLRELGVRLEEMEVGDTGQAKEAEKERLAVHEQEGRQRAWLWLLGGMLLVLACETWLAAKTCVGRARVA